MRNISMKKMKVFISVAQTGSFTDGARRSNISQPAGISIINEIESTVGVDLFVRSGKIRRATLTPRGQEIYETLVRIQSIYDQMLDAISDGKQKGKVQTVWIQSPYTSAISSSWLGLLMLARASGRLSIRSAEWHQIMAAIESRDECVALFDGDVRPKNTEYFSLGTIEMIFALPKSNDHFNIQGDKIAWENVPKDTLIYSAVSPATVERIYENLKMAGATKGDFNEVNCVNILQNVMKETGAPAIIPKIVLNAFPCTDDFRCMEFAHSRVYVSLGLSLPFGHRIRLQSKDLQTIVEQKHLT